MLGGDARIDRDGDQGRASLTPPAARRPAPRRAPALSAGASSEPDVRARDAAVRAGEREQRADGDAVEVGDGAVAVLRDGELQPCSRVSSRSSSRSPRIATAAKLTSGWCGATCSTASSADTQRSALSVRNASTTGPRRASVHELSAPGSSTSQAATAPAAPSSARRATFASPSKSLVTSGAANGGMRVPASSPLDPLPGVVTVLYVM